MPRQGPTQDPPKTDDVGELSVRYGWVARAAASDRHLDRQKLAALETEQVEAGRRHARVLQAAISALTIPVRIGAGDGFDDERAGDVAACGAGDRPRAARGGGRSALLGGVTLPALVQAERLTLGMTTEHYEFSETPKVDVVAQRILMDPAAMDLAIELLDRVARPMLPDESTRLIEAKER